MPDALPALHLSDTINPLGIFEARLTQCYRFPPLDRSYQESSRYESSHRWVFLGEIEDASGTQQVSEGGENREREGT